jgi:hypothetical protein
MTAGAVAAAAAATCWGGVAGGGADRLSEDDPISDAVALAKTVKGFLTATKVATNAAAANAAVFRRRDPRFRGRPNFEDRSSSSAPDKNSGTESSGRNSSRVATDRAD